MGLFDDVGEGVLGPLWPLAKTVGRTLITDPAAELAGATGEFLRSPGVVQTAEELVPGLGLASAEIGTPMTEIGYRAEEEARQRRQGAKERTAAILGKQQRFTPKVAGKEAAKTEPAGSENAIPEDVQTVQPTFEQERNAVEPWKIDEWRRGALQDTAAQAGPFAVRGSTPEYRGAFTPSAKIPDATGSAADFEKARAEQSPLIQERMDADRARFMGERGTELQQQLLQTQIEKIGQTPEEETKSRLQGEIAAYPMLQQMAEVQVSKIPNLDQRLTETAAALLRANKISKPTPEQLAQAKERVREQMVARAYAEIRSAWVAPMLARSSYGGMMLGGQ